MKSDAKDEWDAIDGKVAMPESIASTSESSISQSSDILCIRWEDNNIVRFLTTVHPRNEVTLSDRRKPRKTSSNAVSVRMVFGESERKKFSIPTLVYDYNHIMNGVDLADQRRAALGEACGRCASALQLAYLPDASR